ncbi:MAG: tripartite tricarboxylate transporter substrate binding protein [Alphaproteobacteria bacterium]|nr:MAG: tripartite tricarboxylate transporter substrate binding protein [Alphaproteobacteria bacterium]
MSSAFSAVTLRRRDFLQLAAGAAALGIASTVASAQAYPTRPVHWIVSFTAGGPNDTVARIIGQYLSDRLGQQFVIENKVGAGGNIGMAAVLSSPPDGYTIGFVAPNNAINTTLYEKLPFDFVRDSVPVAGTMLLTNVMVVHPDVPAKTVAEFIAYAKANPGKINMASSGSGTSVHMSGELFKVMTGINMQHVPYRGSAPAMQDLLTNRVQVIFDNLPGSMAHIKAGTLRALGVTAGKRAEALPDVPTIGETVPGYEAVIWYGIVAPKGTPPEVVDTLNTAVNAVLADPQLKARLAALGGEPMPMTPAQFGKLIADETEKWAKVVKFSGAKAD